MKIIKKASLVIMTSLICFSAMPTYGNDFSYGTYVSRVDGSEYTFFEDGSVEVDGAIGVYLINGDQITIVSNGYASKYTFEYLGSLLILYDASGTGIVFDSIGNAAATILDSNDNPTSAEKKLDLNKISDSVMMLYCYAGNDFISQGSGFIAFDSNTLITNYHVIEGTDTIIAIAEDGSEYEVTSIRNYDTERDIAILTIDGNAEREPLSLGDSNEIQKGEEIYTVGSPEGLINSVSSGLLSGTAIIDDKEYIQISAPISEGSSGGICVNTTGDVIGITSAGIDEAQNLNFIIPINDLKTLYNESPVDLTLPEYLNTENPELYYSITSEYVGLSAFYTTYEYYKNNDMLICIEGTIGPTCLEDGYWNEYFNTSGYRYGHEGDNSYYYYMENRPQQNMRYLYHDSDIEPLKKGDSVMLYGKVVDGPLDNFIYFEVYYVVYR